MGRVRCLKKGGDIMPLEFGRDFAVVSRGYKQFRNRYNYRKKDTEKCCEDCDHIKTYEYHGKMYHKCERQGVSNSEASDIRLSCVCDLWVKGK